MASASYKGWSVYLQQLLPAQLPLGTTFTSAQGNSWVSRLENYGNNLAGIFDQGFHLQIIIDWVWFKKTDTEELLTNSSQNKVLATSSETLTERHISNPDLEKDLGLYVCNGTSSPGTHQASITLRVCSCLAALWPLLRILAEVLMLVTIMFVYEKRWKPEEVLDDEDMGSAPLKSGSHHVNDKEKNVLQRHTN
ncbi:PREDICTED: basigin-like [Elephantulus edwardii]|uniref:basigin-like n=1 Tax=Elephantulus edwardii TaxID=28737 RepID=UPI0003F0D5ED|nr:PREDICTED: basigin-like [Elephantulus edwardii]